MGHDQRPLVLAPRPQPLLQVRQQAAVGDHGHEVRGQRLAGERFPGGAVLHPTGQGIDGERRQPTTMAWTRRMVTSVPSGQESTSASSVTVAETMAFGAAAIIGLAAATTDRDKGGVLAGFAATGYNVCLLISRFEVL